MTLLLPLLGIALADPAIDSGEAAPCMPLTFSSALPADGTEDVPVDARPLLLFDGDAACSSQDFHVFVQTDEGVLLDAPAEIDGDNGLAAVVFAEPLASETVHELWITPELDDAAWLTTFTTGTRGVTPFETSPEVEIRGLQAWTGPGLWDYSAHVEVRSQAHAEDLALVHLYDADDLSRPVATMLPEDSGPSDFHLAWEDVGSDDWCFVVGLEDGRGVESAWSDPVCEEVRQHEDESGGCSTVPGPGSFMALLLALAAPLRRRQT